MEFNSLYFLIFLPTVFFIYWIIIPKRYEHQNLFLLIISYLFFGWWDWRFTFLLLLSTTTDYFVGIKIDLTKDQSIKKIWLYLSIIVNLGLLCLFKYFNFFIQNWIDMWEKLGYEMNPVTLNIILPIGISFYTFQTLSYSIDNYRGKIKPTKNFITFATFVSFFPQLVSGPIERASNLLPQFNKIRQFDYNKNVDGMRQILWGFFKKIVIADNCAITVNAIFTEYTIYNGWELLLGAFFFACQIYGDFSGYSDIAIGTAKLFGITLSRNFIYPYFSRDIAEFWRRWHISLSSWFKDYLYIPMGGSKYGKWISIRNIIAIFIISGFWHGANWTFIFWGLTHALFYLPIFLIGKNHQYSTTIVAEDSFFPTIKEFFQMGITFFLTMIAWIFFRSETIGDALLYLQLIPNTIFSLPRLTALHHESIAGPVVIIMFLIEWIQRKYEHGLYFLDTKIINIYFRWGLYYFIILLIIALINPSQKFIYYQF